MGIWNVKSMRSSTQLNKNKNKNNLATYRHPRQQQIEKGWNLTLSVRKSYLLLMKNQKGTAWLSKTGRIQQRQYWDVMQTTWATV